MLKLNVICGLILWLVFSLVINATGKGEKTFRLGVILPREYSKIEHVVQLAVDMINANEIETIKLNGTKLSASFHTASLCNQYDNFQKACTVMKEGVVAIIGPVLSDATIGAQIACSRLHMPQIAPTASDATLAYNPNYNYLLRMSPLATIESYAIAAFVEHYGWTKMAVLTSNTNFGINTLSNFREIASKKLWKILAFEQFDIDEDGQVLNIKSNLRTIKNSGARIILLNCLAPQALIVFKEASKMGIMDRGWCWIVTDTIASESSYLPSDLNGLIGFKYHSNHGKLYQAVFTKYLRRHYEIIEPFYLKYFDSVLAVAYGIQALQQEREEVKAVKLECSYANSTVWKEGYHFFQFITKASGPSTTMSINFTADGGPANVGFDIVNLHGQKWVQVGTWTNQRKLSLDVNRIYFSDGVHHIEDSSSFVRGKNISTTILLHDPYAMIDDNFAVTGRKYKGYMIDLMDEISKNLNFSYHLRVVSDGYYGAKYKTSNGSMEWIGIVGEILDGVVEIAAAPLSLTPERQEVIDFTMPVINQGLSILTLAKTNQGASLFQAILPLTIEVWIGILISLVIVATVTTCMNRWSPFDYYGKAVDKMQRLQHDEQFHDELHRDYILNQIEKDFELESFSFSNNLWYTLASFLSQGADRTPRSTSARLITAIWWFASVIITATYTANLTAFLTINSLQTPINSLRDLTRNPDISYGVFANSSFDSFFQQTTISPYKEVKHDMSNVPTYQEGVQRVLSSTANQQYAYIEGETSLRYARGKYCNLTMTNSFREESLCLGLPKGSLYRREISLQILKLRESGFLDKLAAKWQSEKCKTTDNSLHDPIKFESLAGVFYVILLTVGCCFAVLLMEWIIAAVRDTHQRHTKITTFKEAIKQRLRNILNDYLSDHPCKTQIEQYNATELAINARYNYSTEV